MENTSYIALSRQMGLWRELDMVANNLANMNTTGYQGEQPMFSQFLVRTRDSEQRLPEKLAFTQDKGSYRDTSPGALEQTGNPLDLAIEGDAYFEVRDEVGPMYTRAGRFTMNPDGQVVTAEGLPLMTEANTPLILAPNETQISIASDGTVSTENGQVGKIRLVTFDEPYKMERVAGGLLDAGDMEAKPATDAQLQQGMIEKSNVNPIVEMTHMIQVQRAYEAANNLIEMEHDRQGNAYGVLSGTNN
ncbi:MAG: flagellar basal-body rod protein FlgF [Rhodospirillum sp.]|nr:flagellar basal-body rod protein FlgF [Rhodospirillum sp.]MCF8490670.1 flagellar basal-body rod protein FlgF [Rhodospirillum sp.]